MKNIIAILFLFLAINSIAQTKHNISIKQLKDVDITSTPTTNYILTWNGSFWVAAAPAGSSLTNTYVGVGDGSNLLSGSNQLVFSGGELRIGNADFGSYSIQTTGSIYSNTLINAAGLISGQYYEMSPLAAAPSTSSPSIYYNTTTDKYQVRNTNTAAWEDISTGGGGGAWGTITGTLSDQTDLQTALDAKISGSLTATRVPFSTGASTLSDDASMTWDNTNKRLTLGNNSGFFPLILDGGNGAASSGHLVIRSAGVNKVYFSAGTSQSDLYTINHSFRVYTNGTGNLSFRVGGSTGITYNAEHATTGAHTFQTNTVTRAVIDNGGLGVTGSISLTTAGNKLNITTGSNASIGVSAAMTAGTITISTTAVTANSIIILTHATLGGTQGILSVGTITAGTSFVINSSNAADTGTVNWWIVN